MTKKKNSIHIFCVDKFDWVTLSSIEIASLSASLKAIRCNSKGQFVQEHRDLQRADITTTHEHFKNLKAQTEELQSRNYELRSIAQRILIEASHFRTISTTLREQLGQTTRASQPLLKKQERSATAFGAMLQK